MTRPHRVLVLSALTGVLVGLAVAAFEQVVGHWMLDWTLELSPVPRTIAPVAGVVLAWVSLRALGRAVTPALADEYLDAYHRDDGAVNAREAPAKTTAAAATLGLGGAMGFEGPSIYLGATIGSLVRRRFPRSVEGRDERVLLVAGAAAGVAAIFKAPATGAVFALEVPYHNDTASNAALPAIVAAACSYLTFVVFYGLTPLIPVRGTPSLEARELVGALAIGVLAGVAARGYAALLRQSKRVAATVEPWKRLLACGAGLAVVGAATYAVYDLPLSLGPGYDAIDWSRATERSLGLLLLLLVVRAAATSLTMAAGGVGGQFIPLFVEGWILGAAVEVIVHSHSLLFPVIGAAALLGAGYRTPIAAVVFVAEATGRPEFVVPALIATGVATLLMGRWSVTKSQLEARLDRVERLDRRPITEAMGPVPDPPPGDGVRVEHTSTVGEARSMLASGAVPQLLVVDGTTVVGVVTAASILALEV